MAPSFYGLSDSRLTPSLPSRSCAAEMTFNVVEQLDNAAFTPQIVNIKLQNNHYPSEKSSVLFLFALYSSSFI
ncbi:hypothetical protein [Aeromonas veronii]|uniref:hypothetical protein n=1 Tax=Aeromonas veronii TaxID=654 RepID=UPI003D217CA5